MIEGRSFIGAGFRGARSLEYKGVFLTSMCSDRAEPRMEDRAQWLELSEFPVRPHAAFLVPMILRKKILDFHRQGTGSAPVEVLLDANEMVVGEGCVQAQIRDLQVVLEINESRQPLAILAADDTLRWGVLRSTTCSPLSGSGSGACIPAGPRDSSTRTAR